MAGVTLGLAACSSMPTTAPSPVTVLPSATLAPTSAPILILTLEQLAEQLGVEADALAADLRRPTGENRKLGVVRHYVAVFLASACVEGQEPSAEDFRIFAYNALGNRILVEREARGVIREIISAADRWRNGSLDATTQLCLKPYLYPESSLEAKPAIELYLASSLPPLSPLARGGFEAQTRERADEWFNLSDQQEAYISWLCGNQC